MDTDDFWELIETARAHRSGPRLVPEGGGFP
jgi:hypothetical protein